MASSEIVFDKGEVSENLSAVVLTKDKDVAWYTEETDPKVTSAVYCNSHSL